MRIATMWKPVALLDLGLRPLTNARAINSTERMTARDAPKVVRFPNAVAGWNPDLSIPAFLRRQAE